MSTAVTAPKDENLKDQTLFAVNQSTREVNPRVTFTPAASTLIEVLRCMHREIQSLEPNTTRVLAPEVLDYYSVALLWIRITDLKNQYGNQLTQAEDALLTIAEKNPLTVPAPLLAYLKSYGTILTKLESNLWPLFPDLPTTVVNNTGGYFAPAITEETHNVYEEIPCLGVLATAVQQCLTNIVGRYPSPLDSEDFQVNTNLCGFRPLSRRRDEARAFIQAAAIAEDAFPSNITNAGFNLNLILATSEMLRSCSVFKMVTTALTTLGSAGSQSQTIYLNSYPEDTTISAIHNEVQPSSLGRESTSHNGMAVFTCAQLFKAGTNIQPPPNTTLSWSCVTPIAPWGIPQAWIANRNERRNLTTYWYNPVFVGTRQYPDETILGLVQRFTAK